MSLPTPASSGVARIASRVAVVLALVLFGVSSLEAQRRFPGAPEAPGGRPVSPFFEGWYENPDGTYTLSFGYFNRNQDELLEIPIGPDNLIEPREFDGGQPSLFAPRRHTGVFTVTVPADFRAQDGRVVWTLRNREETHSVPGRVGVPAYQLHHFPMAMGSLPPSLRLTEDGPELWGVMSHAGDGRNASTWSGESPLGSVLNPLQITASVEAPMILTVWVADRLASNAERDPVPGGVTWYTHQGPAIAQFANEAPLPRASDGLASTTVVFTEPGEYLLRVRADNFNPVDSTPGDQCCWTNGYIAVTVSP